MNDRERFVACILGEPVDRPPYWLFWPPWGFTWQQWAEEGKPAALTNWADVQAHFGSDQPPLTVPVNCGPCPRIERTVLHEDEDHVEFVDSWGIRRRDLKHAESMSEFLQFPVRSLVSAGGRTRLPGR